MSVCAPQDQDDVLYIVSGISSDSSLVMLAHGRRLNLEVDWMGNTKTMAGFHL